MKKITRERILTAAKSVFSRHPYNAASIRMIGDEGGFDHPLVSYYFPTKAVLFEAVMENICENFYHAHLTWFEGLIELSPLEGFSLFLDRLLEYDRHNHEFFRIIALNISQADKLSEIPGYEFIIDILKKTRETFKAKVPMQAQPDNIEMFINSFNSLMINSIGARSCQAQILDMKPESKEYRKWVKKTLLYIFLPRFEELLNRDKLLP